MGKSKTGLVAPKKAVDPALAALFTTSAGPVKAPPVTRYVDSPPPKPRKVPEPAREAPKSAKKAPKPAKKAPEPASKAEDAQDSDDDTDSEVERDGDGLGSDDEVEQDGDGLGGDEELLERDDEEIEAANASDTSGDEETEAAEVLEVVVAASREDDGRKRKRKNRDEFDNLESKYLSKLADDGEPSEKRIKADELAAEDGTDAADAADDDDDDAMSVVSETPVHESIAAAANSAANEVEKANRTVFLSNVSADAITSRAAKKTLLIHLASILDKKAVPPMKVESIRFRSTAFATAAIPKRAAYIKKSVMEATTKSTNAYVVYSSVQAARLAVQQLNGTIVLDRHLRVDSVAHPAMVAHRRCVFVGNLGFVDDESVLNVKIDEEGKESTEKRKRTRVPMDVEEGLWRVFSKEAGKVESVRVVRDPITRVGKGIAYVQFYDANAVEAAVLLEGKKFPPMLPRALRVSRCKAPHKTARAMEAKHGKFGAPESRGKPDKRKGNKYVPKATAEDKTLAGRAGKLLGRAAAGQLGAGKPRKFESVAGDGAKRRDSSTIAKAGGDGKVMRSPEDVVFEGRRASIRDGRPKDLKMKPKGSGKSKKSAKPGGRGTARAEKWRASGAAKK
ncbi:nucleolar protein 12 [Lasiosphaeria hispida]|uniref:Nucleolar protein 12 n=1 Tax=Lasiosphaeria hispida TaxID=260671 RepID=A0AAJ0H631_9PEZI|nr:nucleolar protein 12 [Lasiosphaeria hispida]